MTQKPHHAYTNTLEYLYHIQVVPLMLLEVIIHIIIYMHVLQERAASCSFRSEELYGKLHIYHHKTSVDK